jgi:DNA topoisomerase-2
MAVTAQEKSLKKKGTSASPKGTRKKTGQSSKVSNKKKDGRKKGTLDVRNLPRNKQSKQESENEEDEEENDIEDRILKGARKKKTIEEQYTRKTQYQHILDPATCDNYVGSIDMCEEPMYIVKGKKIIRKPIKYVPAFYKCFDEILVNARDEMVRTKQCNEMRAEITSAGEISVWNNGIGIENVMHKKEKMYVVSMIFGTLLTSGNYDQKDKITGGKNGYGAKLANCYSKYFTVENLDSNGVLLKQTWTKNMSLAGKPKISKKKGTPYTKITWMPDYERFGMKSGLTQDVRALLERRVIDVAACAPYRKTIKVSFNGKKINIKDFKQYISLFENDDKSSDRHFNDSDDESDASDYETDADEDKKEKTTPKRSQIVYAESKTWRVGVVYDPEHGGQHVSFVNGINTFAGGTHVRDVLDKIIKKLTLQIQKKHKDLKLKASQIKDNVNIFVCCVLGDPKFGSQVKETLTTEVSKFTTRFDVTDDFVTKLGKSGLFDEAIAFAEMKAQEEIKKGDGAKSKSVKGILKLQDALKAGSRESYKCSLILTEGDSAKNSALGGLSVVGNDYFGVFPLKGKMLNVRDASLKQLRDNLEFQSIRRIIGLKMGMKYTSIKDLRYAKIIIMADQDHDGTHIKALLMNVIHHFWPELFYDVEGFEICSLQTPIVKVGKNLEFYSQSEYEAWKATHNGGKGYGREKYYKGLGTSTPQEARQWFVDFANKLTHYIPNRDYPNKTGGKGLKNFKKSKSKEDDTKKQRSLIPRKGPVDLSKLDATSAHMHLAFNKAMADDRKKWLENYNPKVDIDPSQKQVNTSEFLDTSLIHFSYYSCERGIPRMISGDKPSTSKIMYTVTKRNINRPGKEIKVSSLAGAVTEVADYHHGEASLEKAIVGLGQNFPRSGNNIHLLYPSGQYGGVMEGGDDAAQSRYIFAYSMPILPYIYHPDDRPVLHRRPGDVDPLQCPVVPMILINSMNGIGTGYSNNWLPHNPTDVFDNLERKINGKKTLPMMPWWRFYDGKVVADKDTPGKFACHARYEIVNDSTVHVYELPPGMWNTQYKNHLVSLMDKGDLVADFDEYFNDVRSEVVIHCIKGKLREFSGDREKLEKKLKLVTYVNQNNMHAFDSKGIIHHYKTTEEVFEEFYHARLDMYKRRKKYMLDQLQMEIEYLNWKIKFIEHYLDGKITMVKRQKGKKNIYLPKAEVIAQLKKLGFPMLLSPAERKKIFDLTEKHGGALPINGEDDHESDAEEAADNKVPEKSYKYLTELKFFQMTKEEMQKLLKDYDDCIVNRKKLEKTTEIQIWTKDLKELREAYAKFEENANAEYKELFTKKESLASTNKKRKRGGSKKNKK